MIKYDANNCTDTLVRFIDAVTISTHDANVEWKCIRKDLPVYLSSAIAFGVETGKKHYLTIQEDSPYYELQLADNADILKHNACMTAKKEVIMNAASRDKDKDLYRVMKNLFMAAKQQYEAANTEIKNREKMELEKLLSSY